MDFFRPSFFVLKSLLKALLFSRNWIVIIVLRIRFGAKKNNKNYPFKLAVCDNDN